MGVAHDHQSERGLLRQKLSRLLELGRGRAGQLHFIHRMVAQQGTQSIDQT